MRIQGWKLGLILFSLVLLIGGWQAVRYLKKQSYLKPLSSAPSKSKTGR